MKAKSPMPAVAREAVRSSLPSSSHLRPVAAATQAAAHGTGHGIGHGPGQGNGKSGSAKIAIQMEGFSVSAISRTYNFRVIDAPGESRQFWVHVPLEWFGITPLKFQDCPLITLERLKQELERETEGGHAEANLNLGKQDIQDYLERHYPPKARTWPRPIPPR